MADFDGKDTIIISDEELNELNKGFCGNDLDNTGERMKIAKAHQVKLEPEVPENPWEDLPDINGKYIAKGDKQYIEKINDDIDKNSDYNNQQKEEYIIHPEIIPEPFWGDIDKAKVLILSGNPGYSGIERSFIGDPTLNANMQGNLTQNSPNLIWLDSAKPITNDEVGPHPGYGFWEENTKELRGAIKDNKLNICVIEYFPYHSMKISDEMKECASELPSSKFVDYYIEKAIKDGKWIVILRCKSEWLNRIKGTYWKDSKLKKYKKEHSDRVLIAKGRQMHISSGNLKREIDMNSPAGAPIWQDFVEACKK